MARLRPLVLLLILCLGAGTMALGRVAAPAGGQGASASMRPPGTNYKGPAFTFNKIADGVYHAVGTGSLVVMSNATVVEGDRDVLVVDSQVSPAGAWALREELKAITPKPIRWVVNSHYHFDHSHGNQIYGPEVRDHRPRVRPRSRSSPASRRTRRRASSTSAESRPPSRASKRGWPPPPTTRRAPPSRRSWRCSAPSSKAPTPSSRRRRP